MSVKDELTATNTKTKTTPKAISDMVSKLRRRYRRMFLTAILTRLNMGDLLLIPVEQATVFQGVDDFRLTDDSRIVSRKHESDAEIISHLFHQSENHIGGFVIQ